MTSTPPTRSITDAADTRFMPEALSLAMNAANAP